MTTRPEIGKLRLDSGNLRICDTSMFYDEYFEIDLQPGEYWVTAVLDSEDGLNGFEVTRSQTNEIGEKLETLNFEFSQAGVFDGVRTAEVFSGTSDDDMVPYYDSLDNSDDFGVLRSVPGLEIPFIRCSMGLGDIYQLLNEGSIVGVRVDFEVEDE